MDPSNIWLCLSLLAMDEEEPPPLLVQEWLQAMPPLHSSQGPPYQNMGQQHQNQYGSNWGPIRHHHHGSLRMTEAPTPYQLLLESSGPIASDRSTGTHPRMGAVDNSAASEKRKKPYYRHQPSPSETWRQQRGKEDLSGYEIPVMELRTGVTAGGSNTPAVIPVPAPAPPIASTSAAPIPTPASTSVATPARAEMRRPGCTGNTKTKLRRRTWPVYDDDSDIHTVSSGSDTD
ncbi:hypothetical protein BYT27DRAFT_7238010 [Phlegmacium glaucopus]|nr:hypothetical protein BYT27DRAFT_7238010 [Phlegmacium glaucopus]